MSRNPGSTGAFLGMLATIAALACLMSIPATGQSGALDRPGDVFVLTNQASGNSVMVFARASDGSLSFSGSFDTGGLGMGSGPDPLGSQGSLVLTNRDHLLIGVNPGSNDISVFAVNGHQLQLLDREPSEGQMPVSVAVHEGLLYVLNAGGTPNIQGFFILPNSGHLSHVPGSGRLLAGGSAAAPAEVAFSPEGDVLMVTEKGTNKIDTWTVNDHGFAQNGRSFDSSGGVPFGFSFAHDFAIVSEAGPSALSSYQVAHSGQLQVATGSLGDTQRANCWVVVTNDRRFTFTTNTGSGSISSYAISPLGQLTLLAAVAATTGPGSAPIDMALSNNSRFLYVRDGLTGMVHGFSVSGNGGLGLISSIGGIPAGAQGLAAR